MNQQEKIQALVKKLATVLPAPYLQQIKAHNMSIVSDRSARFDLPKEPGADGFIRVKITAQPNGEWLIRTAKIIDLEDIPNVSGEALTKAITAFTTGSTGAPPDAKIQ